jgi:hypothetical protein
MRKIAVALFMLSLFAVSSARSGEDPKAQQRRDAKQIDDRYENTIKASSWATSPKPMTDPWQSVKSPPTSEKK